MKTITLTTLVAISIFLASCNSMTSDNTPAANAKPANAEANKPAENTAPAATPNMANDAWMKSPQALSAGKGAKMSYTCPANGKGGPVWGTDTYTADSSICEAAVHFGAITREKGGSVQFEMKPGLPKYKGTDRNGVVSSSWDKFDMSFVFVK